MRPIYLTRQLSVAADDNGIAEAQAPAGAGALALDGVLVVSGVAQLGPQRQVLFTFAADETGTDFVVTGTDDQGHVISETVAGTATTAVSALSYSTVTEITISAAAAGNIIVGTNGVGASPPVILDQYVPDFSVMLAVVLRSGAANFTAQYTFDDVFAAYAPYNSLYTGSPAGDPTTIVWWDHSDITAQAVSAKGALIEPVKAVRLLTNSGTGELEFQIVQGGTQ
jgi:hypothetical protein